MLTKLIYCYIVNSVCTFSKEHAVDLIGYITIVFLSFFAGMKYASRDSVKERHFREVKNTRWWKEVELGRKFRYHILAVSPSPSSLIDRHSNDHGYELYDYNARNGSTDFRVSIKFGYDEPVRVSLGHLMTYKEFHFSADEKGIQGAFELLTSHFQKDEAVSTI